MAPSRCALRSYTAAQCEVSFIAVIFCFSVFRMFLDFVSPLSLMKACVSETLTFEFQIWTLISATLVHEDLLDEQP